MDSAVLGAGPVLSQGWLVPIVDVPCQSVLMEMWDEVGDFAQAFVAWGESMTKGYDAAHAAGRLPSQMVEADAARERWFSLVSPSLRARYVEAEKILLSGPPQGTKRQFCAEFDLSSRALEELLALHKIDWPLYNFEKDPMRVAVEKLVRDGLLKPREIVAELERQFPGAEMPHRNTVTQWKRRMQ